MDQSLLPPENDEEEIAVAAKEIAKLLKSRGVDIESCTKAITEDGSLVTSSDNV